MSPRQAGLTRGQNATRHLHDATSYVAFSQLVMEHYTAMQYPFAAGMDTLLTTLKASRNG